MTHSQHAECRYHRLRLASVIALIAALTYVYEALAAAAAATAADDVPARDLCLVVRPTLVVITAYQYRTGVIHKPSYRRVDSDAASGGR